MANFLSGNWTWILLIGGMAVMHLGHRRSGHGGHDAGHAGGGCGGHGSGHAGHDQHAHDDTEGPPADHVHDVPGQKPDGVQAMDSQPPYRGQRW